MERSSLTHSGWNFLVDKAPHHDKVSSIEGVLVVQLEAFLVLVCNKINNHPAFFALKVIPTNLGVSLKIMFDFDKLLSSLKYTGLLAY